MKEFGNSKALNRFGTFDYFMNRVDCRGVHFFWLVATTPNQSRLEIARRLREARYRLRETIRRADEQE